MNGKWLFCIICWCCLIAVNAQNTPQELYQNGGGDYLPLYNGKLEPGYLYGYLNTPYWPQEYTKGDIVFRNRKYKNVEMQLDCYRQGLLVLSNDRMRRIEVDGENVQFLEIGGMEYMWQDKKNGAPLSAYYSIINEGKEIVCRLHYATKPTKKIKDRQIVMEFDRREKLYLIKDGKWHELHGLASYIKLHKQQKEKLQRFCKEHQLLMKNDTDWKLLASYCETLFK